jgi:hypothetical protein
MRETKCDFLAKSTASQRREHSARAGTLLYEGIDKTIPAAAYDRTRDTWQWAALPCLWKTGKTCLGRILPVCHPSCLGYMPASDHTNGGGGGRGDLCACKRARTYACDVCTCMHAGLCTLLGRRVRVGKAPTKSLASEGTDQWWKFYPRGAHGGLIRRQAAQPGKFAVSPRRSRSWSPNQRIREEGGRGKKREGGKDRARERDSAKEFKNSGPLAPDKDKYVKSH